jgi:O-antigen chain-terminating methyltransferase
VVDLGCGRGEFLELLKAGGIESYGVDSDRVACQVCRSKLLKIVEGDIFEHLKQLPDRFLGGVVSARFIEYLPSHLQLELVELCSKRLKPGGVMVIETINPDSDFPFGRNSQIDPSHLRPIYPEILKSMLDSNGFYDSQICVLAPRAVSLTRAAGQIDDFGNGGGNGECSAYSSGSGALAYAAIARRS